MPRALKNGKEQGLFWLKPETLERLRVEAFERRMKRSEIIEEALTLYFETKRFAETTIPDEEQPYVNIKLLTKDGRTL